jgi:hypothetical protein
MFFTPNEGSNELPDPRPIYSRLVEVCAEFAHLKDHEPAVGFLFREGEWRKGNSAVLSTCQMPRGELMAWSIQKVLGYAPVYLITLNMDWWREASDRQREALVHHEMMHTGIGLDKDGCERFDRLGNPVWALRNHSLREFRDTVRRSGAWDDGVKTFGDAPRQGGRRMSGLFLTRRPSPMPRAGQAPHRINRKSASHFRSIRA